VNHRDVRCSDSARARHERLVASALKYSRFLLLEVPGPWGRSALADSRLDAGVTRNVAQNASAADVRVVLIRRPGRDGTSRDGGRLAWALADTTLGIERIQWGAWSQPADLLDLDLTADPPATALSSGPQRVALVCTNAKRDQCCAIRGRPVAAALAAGTGWDTWECSHLGGHRFAATALLLPSGEMFGELDPDTAIDVLERLEAGEVALSHHRGRCGQPPAVQAALHGAAERLGDSRQGAVHVSSPPQLRAGRPAEGAWDVEVIHQVSRGREARYTVTVAARQSAAVLRSCADDEPKSETEYEVIGFVRVG
jgi:hypothetical protein